MGFRQTARFSGRGLSTNFFSVGIFIALASPALSFAMPTTINYDALEFNSSGQSMWGAGNAPGLDIDRFLGVEWNESVTVGGFTGGIETVTVSYPHPHLPSGWECHGVLCTSGHFHNSGTIHEHTENLGTIDTTTGAQATARTSGKVGFQFGLSVDSGSVETTVDFDADLLVPDSNVLRPNEFFGLNPNSSLVGGQLATNFPELSASLDAIVGVRASVDGEVCAALLGCQTASTGQLGFADQTIPIVSFNENSNGQIKILGALDPALFQFDNEINIPSTIPGGSFGGVTVHVPDADASGGVVGNKLVASGQDDLIKLTADLDGLALAPLGLPGGGISVNAGILSVSADLIDIDTGPILTIVQNFEYTPTLLVDLVFDNPVMIAGMAAAQTSWSGLWSALPDIALLSRKTLVTPTFSVQGMLTNNTLLGIDGIFQLDILKASFALEALGLSFDLGQVGPLFQVLERSNLFNTPPLFSNTFALSGFQSIQGDAFLIRTVPEPGTIVLFITGLLFIGFKVRSVSLTDADKQSSTGAKKLTTAW